MARARRLVISVCLAVSVLAGLLGIGYVAWDPEPPSDPDAVALRIRYVEGLQGPSFLPRPIPAITVYGNGRIITTATGPSRSVVHHARLTREAYRRMYRDARLAGLGTSRTYDGDDQILDGGSTVVELRSGGRHVSTLYAGAGGPRPWMIQRLAEHLRKVPRKDLVRPPIEYTAARVAIAAWRPDKTSFGEVEVTWPWPLRPLTEGNPASCTILTGAAAQTAIRLATGQSVGWQSGKHTYLVQFRPLLPDEKDCSALR